MCLPSLQSTGLKSAKREYERLVEEGLATHSAI